MIVTLESGWNAHFAKNKSMHSFSSQGVTALYNYYSDLEEGHKLDVDIVAIRCEWAEVNKHDLVNDYASDELAKAYHEEFEDDTIAEIFEAILDELRAKTTVIETIEDWQYLVRQF